VQVSRAASQQLAAVPSCPSVPLLHEYSSLLPPRGFLPKDRPRRPSTLHPCASVLRLIRVENLRLAVCCHRLRKRLASHLHSVPPRRCYRPIYPILPTPPHPAPALTTTNHLSYIHNHRSIHRLPLPPQPAVRPCRTEPHSAVAARQTLAICPAITTDNTSTRIPCLIRASRQDGRIRSRADLRDDVRDNKQVRHTIAVCCALN
jgi:hypothetical protein